MLGWIFRRVRKWHLAAVVATAFSWFILGIWYGWGYCLFTDWHWQVREKLGYYDQSNSYIHFLVLKLTGINFSEKLIDVVTMVVFIITIVLSIGLNIHDHLKRKRNQ